MKNLSVRDMVLVALFAALTAVLAQISIALPFGPIPITGQTLAVMLSGALLGARLGAYSQVIYLLLGAVGLPVFAKSQAGLNVLVGPSGGFLFSFILGAYLIGKLLERRQKPSLPYLGLVTAIGGMLVVYLIGVPWLAYVTGMTLPRALAVGVWPFILGDLLKVIVSSIIVQGMLARNLTRAWQS